MNKVLSCMTGLSRDPLSDQVSAAASPPHSPQWAWGVVPSGQGWDPGQGITRRGKS